MSIAYAQGVPMTRQWRYQRQLILLSVTVVSFVGCGRAATETPSLATTLTLTYPGGEKSFGFTVGHSVALVAEARDEAGRVLTGYPMTFTSRNPASLEVTSTGVMNVKATPGGYVVAEAAGRVGILRDSIQASVIWLLPSR